MTDDMPLFPLRVDRLLWTLSGYYPTWDGALVDALMDRLALDGRKRVTKLSRGQGTRLRLIVALAHRPKLVLLDEPAAGLDVDGRRSLAELVREVVADGRSVVVSSPHLTDVERIADRLFMLDAGRVVREGATTELLGQGSLEDAMSSWTKGT